MFCLLACFCGKNHIELKESTPVYSSDQSVLIGGKKWRFIYQTSTDKYLFYLYI
jgi:hypothetical protein